MKKICKKCNQLKQHKAYGLCGICYSREYRKTHKKAIKEYMQGYREIHKEEIKKQQKQYYEIHRENRKKYREENEERIRKQTKVRNIRRYNEINSGKTRIVLRGSTPYLIYSGNKYVHRVIAEKVLGRRLKPHEVVHHINGDSLNNRNCNLLICTQNYHRRLHRKSA